MNDYINKLIEDDKLRLSVDKSKTFGFKLGDKWVGKDKVVISGPCSVESRDMIVDWSEELKDVGVTGIFLGYYFPWDGKINAEIASKHGFTTYHKNVEGSIVDYENLDLTKVLPTDPEHTDLRLALD